MNILQTTTFSKQVKKLHKNQKQDLDQAIKTIAATPSVGEMKKGDLSGIQVYKFKMVGQLTLLAYEFYENELKLILMMLGSHENFYRDLKK
jgi:mRNA-degrading endonuclease YafQ of YafQ-DinJ toxin-antitoxin module